MKKIFIVSFFTIFLLANLTAEDVNLNMDAIRTLFGEPDRIISEDLGNTELWCYKKINWRDVYRDGTTYFKFEKKDGKFKLNIEDIRRFWLFKKQAEVRKWSKKYF